ERRQMQAAVDLASIAAVRDPARAETIAREVLAEAGLPSEGKGVRLVVEPGRYRADPALPVPQRFVAGGRPVNAVRVAYRGEGEMLFARWNAPPAISAEAVATVTPRVSFSVGSRLARIGGGIANPALNRLLGTGLSLTAVDYTALADARVHALD